MLYYAFEPFFCTCDAELNQRSEYLPHSSQVRHTDVVPWFNNEGQNDIATTMPGIARKVSITATSDGLVLQPLPLKGQRPPPAVKISYKNAAIGPVLSGAGGDSKSEGKGFEVFGIVGISSTSKF